MNKVLLHLPWMNLIQYRLEVHHPIVAELFGALAYRVVSQAVATRADETPTIWDYGDTIPDQLLLEAEQLQQVHQDYSYLQRMQDAVDNEMGVLIQELADRAYQEIIRPYRQQCTWPGVQLRLTPTIFADDDASYWLHGAAHPAPCKHTHPIRRTHAPNSIDHRAAGRRPLGHPSIRRNL